MANARPYVRVPWVAGPSLYFHQHVIERLRSAASMDEVVDDVRFCEYVQPALRSWGMHPMDLPTGWISQQYGRAACTVVATSR
jgi:hypothetical protein